jgi:hypothetical protein
MPILYSRIFFFFFKFLISQNFGEFFQKLAKINPIFTLRKNPFSQNFFLLRENDKNKLWKIKKSRFRSP